MSMPPAGGVRVDYAELPASVRAWADDALGEPVAEAVTQPGGFSPGVAARVRGVSGRRAFVKAVSREANADSPDMHRREARITASLPDGAPAPRLLSSYDDGTWVALMLEDIDGRHPMLPWREDELRRVVDALADLHDAGTPCPVADLESAAEAHADLFDNWRVLAARPLPGLDEWVLRHLDRLADLECGWTVIGDGDTLLHVDVRADNMLLTGDRVVFLDWPSAARGARIFDLASFAPSVGMQGGPDPETLLAMSREGRAADREVVSTLVAAVTGYFCRRALLPPPPGLPTVRAFQAAQGEVALGWLRTRTGWP